MNSLSPRFRRLAPAALIISVVVACAGESSGASETAPASTAVSLGPSDVAVVRVVELTDGVAVSGTLEPAQTVELRTQINGRIRRVAVDRGSRVRRGEVLVEIQAEGARGQLEGAQAAVASGEAALALAEQRLASARRLHEAGAISDIDLRASEAAHRAAAAQLGAARAQLAVAGEVESHATVRAPIDGVVSVRSVDEGESVRDGGVLITVVDTRTLELAAQIGVDEAMKVRVGAPVVFRLDAAGGARFEGRVTRVDPRADPGTRQVGVASSLPNTDGRIIAGQYARGRVLTGRTEQVAAVPIGAVRDSAGVASVLLIEGGRLARRQVTLGARDEERGLVAVTAGLAEGDRVLAVPVLGAAEGLAVTFAADSGARAPAAPPPTARDTLAAAETTRPGGR